MSERNLTITFKLEGTESPFEFYTKVILEEKYKDEAELKSVVDVMVGPLFSKLMESLGMASELDKWGEELESR